MGRSLVVLLSGRLTKELRVIETVSVVVPYYNGSRFVADAIASVRAQTLPAKELLIVDDGSRPEEAAALDRAAAAAGDSFCRIIHLARNRGVSVARNVGIARATGTHVAFLDCDDLWREDKLDKQMSFFQAHPEYRAVHCSLKVIYDDGRETVSQKGEVGFDDLVSFPCPIFPSAVIMHREALLESGLFDPTKRVCEDLDLFLRFTSHYPIGCVDEPLMTRRVQAEGASRNLPRFFHDADRVYRDFRYVFKDQDAAADALVELHTDFLLRAVYARDRRLFWDVLRRGTRNDVTFRRLVPRLLGGLLRNRLARRPSKVDSGKVDSR
jgi:glycosyltransferase involved in cell wall biosynthesis